MTDRYGSGFARGECGSGHAVAYIFRMEGPAVGLCAQIVTNGLQQDDSERYRTERQSFARLCNGDKLRGLTDTVEGLKIRRPSGLGGSTPPPGTTPLIPNTLQ